MQTYKDIQVIIVDDCSKDDYSYILSCYSKLLNIQYKRLDKNVGSGEARNVGLNMATSEYLCFCDSDDSFLNAFAIEKMVNDIESGDYDFCSYGFVQQHPEYSFSSTPCNATWIFGKLFKREFIEKHHIRYDVSRFNEDVGFNQICYALTNKIYKSNETYYLHHMNENSVTKGQEYSTDDMVSFVSNYLYAYNFVKDKTELDEKAQWQFLDGLLIMYNFYTEMVRTKDEEYCNRFKQQIIQYYSSIFSFAQPLICSDEFSEHYFSIYKSHGLYNKKLISTVDWYTFINDIDRVRREADASLF